MPVLTRERRSVTVMEDEDGDAVLEPAERKTHEQILEALDKLPTVKYPEEVLRRLDRDYEEALAQLACGELKPQTVAEIAAEYGIMLG